MKDLLLALVFAALLGYGYRMMTRLDHYVSGGDDQRARPKPPCI